MSTMYRGVGQLDIDAFSLYFVDPAAFVRTVVLTIGEIAKELIEARRQRVQDVQPRVHRGFTFADPARDHQRRAAGPEHDVRRARDDARRADHLRGPGRLRRDRRTTPGPSASNRCGR